MRDFEDFELVDTGKFTDDEIIEGGRDLMETMATPGWKFYQKLIEREMASDYKVWLAQPDSADTNEKVEKVFVRKHTARGLAKAIRLALRLVDQANELIEKRRVEEQNSDKPVTQPTTG